MCAPRKQPSDARRQSVRFFCAALSLTKVAWLALCPAGPLQTMVQLSSASTSLRSYRGFLAVHDVCLLVLRARRTGARMRRFCQWSLCLLRCILKLLCLQTSQWNPHPCLRPSQAAGLSLRSEKIHLHRIPAELYEAIAAQGLDAGHVLTLAVTCKRVASIVLSGLPELWFRLSLDRFSMDDLLGCPEGSALLDAFQNSSGSDCRKAFLALSRPCVCRQCGLHFTAGARSGCKRHTGVLISGHRMNGHNAKWTCCGEGRHADGCEKTLHVPSDEDAAWRCGGPKGCARSPLGLIPSSCTGIPGSRIRGRTPEQTLTFLDLLEPMPPLTL